ncbi:DUF6691 family protein [Roseovarius salinarum]|uniref:DUF6691 family protein n=1 Tax=Roseovarius salinarum TaxID=1981892 RepID=UPI000C3451D5|nr:DUF6691 family protein [Roseovarius salinarum]
MRILLALVAGGLFGAGLFVSGMTDTAKVQGWLDVFGNWDPTLAFVLGGALLPMAVAWRLARAHRPVVGGEIPQPPTSPVDARLLAGSALFGAGWGLVGLCPGPAIASLTYGGTGHIVFFVAMVAGMILLPLVTRAAARRSTVAAE